MRQVQEFRGYVENRMVEFEKQTGIVVERILETRSIRYVMDDIIIIDWVVCMLCVRHSVWLRDGGYDFNDMT